MKAGEKISTVFQSVKKFISDKNSNLGVHSNFGFGIGFNYKEDSLTISASNQTVIKSGMTFHVRVTLTNVHKEASRSVIAIGDTIMIDETGQPKVVTAGIQKKYSEISYSLEDEEVEQPAKAKPVVKSAKAQPVAKKSKAESSEDFGEESEEENSEEIIVAGRTGNSVIKSTRLRSKANEQKVKVNELESRKEHQHQLYLEKQTELKIRFNRGEISVAAKKEKVKKMDTLTAFKSADSYPKDIIPG